MTASVKSGMIGAAVGVVIAIAAVCVYNSFSGKTDVEKVRPVESAVVEKVQPVESAVVEKVQPQENAAPANAKPMETVKKKSVKVEAVDRVHPKIVKGMFEMTGRGSDAKWLFKGTANFHYKLSVSADTEILSKETMKSGMIKVEEKRTFHQVSDSLVASNVDFQLDLDTLPVDTFSKIIDVGVAIYVSLTGDSVTGSAVKSGKDAVHSALKKVDGISVRKILGLVNIPLPNDIENNINKLAAARFKNALGVIRDAISGKSFIITYYQEQSGQPLMVTFKYADGSEIYDDEVKTVLRRVNAFFDYNVMPDNECRPGDSWNIEAENIQEIFDPFADGTYTGKLKASRRADAADGDWSVEIAPGTITVVADNGTVTGSMMLNHGRALVNPEKYTVNDMFVKGNANISKITRHHLLFTAKLEGACDFTGRLITRSKE